VNFILRSWTCSGPTWRSAPTTAARP